MSMETEGSTLKSSRVNEILSQFSDRLNAVNDIPLARASRLATDELEAIKYEIVQALTQADISKDDLIEFIADSALDLYGERDSISQTVENNRKDLAKRGLI